jgi:hypothetical protein
MPRYNVTEHQKSLMMWVVEAESEEEARELAESGEWTPEDAEWVTQGVSHIDIDLVDESGDA